VDLNRNFDAAWKTTSSRGGPSSERYKGEAPNSAAETAALANYTLALMPDATISYHSTGSIIYYEYGNKKGVNAASKSLGQAVLAVTGYPLIGQGGLDAGGFKDWCIDTLQIPSLTIEMGCGAAPVQPREIYSVFARNLRLMPAIQNWLEMQ
jgi:g-D-glutamyl-meso-diaminopimelate peptidase